MRWRNETNSVHSKFLPYSQNLPQMQRRSYQYRNKLSTFGVGVISIIQSFRKSNADVFQDEEQSTVTVLGIRPAVHNEQRVFARGGGSLSTWPATHPRPEKASKRVPCISGILALWEKSILFTAFHHNRHLEYHFITCVDVQRCYFAISGMLDSTCRVVNCISLFFHPDLTRIWIQQGHLS